MNQKIKTTEKIIIANRNTNENNAKTYADSVKNKNKQK